MASEVFDLITIGRVSVDIYPLQTGVPLPQVQTFQKFLGGSATNVACAAAKYGLKSAVIKRTGNDPFGDYIKDEIKKVCEGCEGLGIEDRLASHSFSRASQAGVTA